MMLDAYPGRNFSTVLLLFFVLNALCQTARRHFGMLRASDIYGLALGSNLFAPESLSPEIS